MRSAPFRGLDRLAQQFPGAAASPAVMPIDAYEREGAFVVHVDLPGVDPDSIGPSVERNVLTARIPVAERAGPRRIEIGQGGGGPERTAG